MTNIANYFRSLITVQTQTSLHAGVLGGDHIIDRPIHRDVHANIPKISSNALKGAIREQWSITNTDGVDEIFGSSKFDLNRNKKPKAGLISFTDARLLFFPVQSKAGGWAWVTCPSILKKWLREATMAIDNSGVEDWIDKLDNHLSDNHAVYAGEKLKISADGKNFVVLYRHKLEVDTRLDTDEDKGSDWAKKLQELLSVEELAERLVIVSNDNFSVFTKLYTETITRNKVNDETKAVTGGGLFTEEYLPANSIMYAMAFSMPNATQQDIKDKLGDTADKTIQLGGNATLGKGLCKIKWQFPLEEEGR